MKQKLYFCCMDKRTTRQIGFKRNAVNVPAKTPKPEKEIKESQVEDVPKSEIDLSKVAQIQEAKSLKIIKWIKDHPDFKWGAMCVKLKIDKSNFYRIIKSSVPEIKLEQIPVIEKYIKHYGYAE